jgi:peptidoglycan/LPS O-acetylase OafA/YrhL
MLTSLRFFAALDVVFFHLAPQCSNRFLRSLASSGPEMVEFFFVLSGFILAYVYISDESAGVMAVNRVDFWKARLARILPAYFLGLLLLAPIFFYTGLVSRIVLLGEFLPGLVLVPVLLQAWWPPAALLWNIPAWSLSVEVFFYVVFPSLIGLCAAGRGGRAMAVSFAAVVGAAMVRIAIADVLPPSKFLNHFLWYFPPMHLPLFMFGMALGRWFLDSRSSRLLSQPAVLLWGGIVITVLLLGFRAWLPGWAVTAPVMSLVFGAVIIGAAASPPDRGLLRAPLLILLGEASYALYILHMPIGFWWKLSVGGLGVAGDWLRFTAFVILAVGLSLACFLWVETPLRRVILRFAQCRRLSFGCSIK